MYERILVPLDGSVSAEAALSHAEAIARKFGSAVVLLNVHAGTSEAGARQAETYLNTVRARLEREGLTVAADVKTGAPAEEILRHAGEHGASLIIMSSHGWTAHRRVLDATIAHEVMQKSHLPILLVRPPEFRQTL